MFSEVLIDNSVWVDTVANPILREIIEQLRGKHEFRTTEVTDEEVGDSEIVLNSRTAGAGEQLRKFYEETDFTGLIKVTEAVEELASEYMSLLKPSKKQAKEIIDDLRIAACAALDNIDYVLTFNRTTLGSEEFQAVYHAVNERRKLRTPQFLTTVESFRRLLLL